MNTQYSGNAAEIDLLAAPRQQSEILRELWAVKTKLNAEAGYDLDRLIAIVRREAAPYFDADGRVRVPT